MLEPSAAMVAQSDVIFTPETLASRWGGNENPPPGEPDGGS